MTDHVALPKAGLVNRVLNLRPVRAAVALHEHHPKRAAAVFFLSGIGWDAATIFRIDSLVDNVIISLYLGLLCLLYSAATLDEAGRLTNPLLIKLKALFPLASQFLLGALFSMFVFFYSQSASWSETSIFLVVLIGLLVGNELLHDRMFSARLRLALLFFVLASFLVYFVPILTGIMTHVTFSAGLLLAAAIVGGITRYLWKRDVFRGNQLRWTIALIVGLFAFLEAAYVMNWIPPVPMAVREAGIFHEVRREGDAYRMRHVKSPWYKPWVNDDSQFSYLPKDTVFAYTAVFAPTRIEKRIVHVWETRATPQAPWTESDRIAYVVAGGRSAGYRGYTRKRNLAPGEWRVRVETDGGRLLSRIRFEIIPADEPNRQWEWRTD